MNRMMGASGGMKALFAACASEFGLELDVELLLAFSTEWEL